MSGQAVVAVLVRPRLESVRISNSMIGSYPT